MTRSDLAALSCRLVVVSEQKSISGEVQGDRGLFGIERVP